MDQGCTVNHPGIFQVGVVTDDGGTVTVTGWGLTYCRNHCPCHEPLRIAEDQTTGSLGLRQSRACACCVPWTWDELAAICRDLAPA